MSTPIIKLPYLKNIIPQKCTGERTTFSPSCEIDSEVFQKMAEVKAKKGEPFPYEMDSDGCVVILGNIVEPVHVTNFCSDYRNAFARVHGEDLSTLPRSLPELQKLSLRLGVPLFED